MIDSKGESHKHGADEVLFPLLLRKLKSTFMKSTASSMNDFHCVSQHMRQLCPK